MLGEDVTAADATMAAVPKLQVTFLNAAEVVNVLPVEISSERGVEVCVVANQELLKEVIPGSRSTRFITLISPTPT